MNYLKIFLVKLLEWIFGLFGKLVEWIGGRRIGGGYKKFVEEVLIVKKPLSEGSGNEGKFKVHELLNM